MSATGVLKHKCQECGWGGSIPPERLDRRAIASTSPGKALPKHHIDSRRHSTKHHAPPNKRDYNHSGNVHKQETVFVDTPDTDGKRGTVCTFVDRRYRGATASLCWILLTL